DVRAQALKRLCHLDADRATAEDHETFGDLARPGGLAIGPDSVQLAQARNRWDHRFGSCCDHDVTRAVAPFVNLDDAVLDHPAVSANKVDSGIREPFDLSGVVVTRHHVVAP